MCCYNSTSLDFVLTRHEKRKTALKGVWKIFDRYFASQGKNLSHRFFSEKGLGFKGYQLHHYLRFKKFFWKFKEIFWLLVQRTPIYHQYFSKLSNFSLIFRIKHSPKDLTELLLLILENFTIQNCKSYNFSDNVNQL